MLISPLGGDEGQAFPKPRPMLYLTPNTYPDTFAHEFGHCCDYQAPRDKWDGFSSHHIDSYNVMAIPPYYPEDIDRGDAYVDQEWCDAVAKKF